jgi:hypothetical protein
VRSLFTVLIAGLLGFAAARMGGSPFVAKQVAPPESAVATPAPARESADIETPAPGSLSPDLTKPIAERLKATLRSKNPLEAAALALPVIDSMTLEDFRNLGAEPRQMPIPFIGSFDPEFCHGFMDALIARWFEVDPAGALASIQDLEKKLIIKPGQRWAGAGEFSAALARVHPEMVLDALGDHPAWDRSDHDILSAFTVLGARDPAAARRYLERIADSERRKSAEIAIAEGVAKSDPLAAVALARTLNNSEVFSAAIDEAERIGPGVLRQVLLANDGKFPLGYLLPELVLRHPNEDWRALTDEALSSQDTLSVGVQREARKLPVDEGRRILARIDELPLAARESIALALADRWALEEPRQATEWALAHAGDTAEGAPAGHAFTWAFRRWMETDEKGAVAWWSSLPASPQRDRAGFKIAATLAYGGRSEEALAFFDPQQPGAASEEIAVAIASAQAYSDPAAAAAWLDALPAGLETSKAIAPIIEEWIGRDAEAAARWVEAQPAGPRREAALQAYTHAATELDPAAAGVWAATIGDPASRAKAAEFIFSTMHRRDPAAARAFVRGLPGADPAWAERLIRLER